ncbi:MAG: hypothetical protein ACRD2J_17955, partial [Thermoanaerobaculia bacterium]
SGVLISLESRPMWGLASWIAAGLAAALLARLVKRRRAGAFAEIAAAAGAALLAGFIATWLDFGGIRVFDVRSAAFAFLAGAAAAAGVRLATSSRKPPTP